MKKLFSLLVAIVMASSLFATDYYLTVKSNNTAEGEVSFSQSSGFSGATTNTKIGTTTTSTKSFYVKAKAGKQFAYAKSNYSTNTWYINSSTSSLWSASPTWNSTYGTQMFTVKVSNLGMTSTKTNCVFTIYFKDLNVLTFKNEDGTTLKTYQLRDNEATPSTSDLFSIRPTKAEDANYTYSFKGWFNGNTEYSGGYGKYITSNQTYTAVFTATPKVSYVTATFNNYDGTLLYTNSSVTSGTTPTYSGADPTRPATQTESEVTTYTFTGWDPALDDITTNTTYTAQFSSTTAPRTYTIRFLMDDGTTVLSSAQVAYNANPIEPAEPTKIGTEEYSYNFTGWTPAVTAVTGDQDYVAVFEQVAKAPKYDLTIGAFTNGSVTLTANGKTDVVPAAGGTYQYEEGTTIIVKAVPAKGYHFNQWNDANKAASRQVSEIAANMTLTPTFAENTPFLMDDTWEKATFISNCAAATGVLTVTLKDRTYSAGQWATLSVPFNCTLDQEDELYNAVYKLHTLTLAQDGGSVSFEFIRTNVVEANEPYLIVPRHDISTVVFHGVTLTTPAEVSRTTDDRVTFVSGLWKQTIAGPNEFYVATGNSLRYASTLGSVVKGNRAFFRKINDAASSSAPRRAIMVIDGEEVEVEIAGDAIEEVQDVRKYIENGVLIIERNGVRMDAQGKRID